MKNFGLDGVSSSIQFGKSGPRLLQTGGLFQAKDAANAAYVRIQVANASSAFDAVNFYNLNSEVSKIQTAVGLAGNSAYVANTFTTYLSSATSFKNATELLDIAVAAIQTELNTSQTGSGLNANGTYTANASGFYIAAATSLKDADNRLDFNIKSIQTELDATQTGSGLNATGTYTANATGNYISAATSLKNADDKLDTAIKNVQNELDFTQTAVGLQTTGALPAWIGVNYVGNTTTVLQAVATLDTQLKTLNDAVTGFGNVMNYIGTVAGGASSGAAVDLNTLGGGQNAGDYYKVSASGYFKVGAAGSPFYANQNDGLVKNTSSGWDIIDNTDSTVTGTTNRISVTGTTDQGFVVDISASYAGQSTITTLGTVATGTWNATTIAVGKGGTGYTSYAQGDLLVGNGSSGLNKLTRGSAKYYLRVNAAGTDLEYAALVAGDVAFASGGYTSNTVSGALAEIKTTANTIVSGAGLSASGSYAANVSANYIAAATSLKDADDKLDAALAAINTTIASQLKDEILSVNGKQSFKVTNTTSEVYGNVNSVKTKIAEFTQSTTTNSYFRFDLSTAAKVKLQSLSNTATDVDVVIDPQGAGTVDVSSSRITNISDPVGANDGMNLQFSNANYTRRKALDVTETNSNQTIGTVSGTVVRAYVNVTAAWQPGSTLTVGTSISNGLIVGLTDVDLTQTGLYVVDTCVDVNATVIAYIAGSGTGTGKIVIEYLSN